MRLFARALAGQLEGDAEAGQGRSQLVGDVPQKPFLGRNEGLDPLRHEVEISAQVGDFVPPPDLLPNPGGKVAGGETLGGLSQLPDRGGKGAGQQDQQAFGAKMAGEQPFDVFAGRPGGFELDNEGAGALTGKFQGAPQEEEGGIAPGLSLSAFENLRFYGKMYEVRDLMDRIDALLDLVGLSEYRNDPVDTFSRGMQQRLSVARAIIHDPQILFLDEPYTGLDQHGAEELKKLLKRFRNQGKTILMTSHNIDRGLELCNQTAILKSGRLVFKEETSGILKDDFKQLYFNLTGENPLSVGVSS